MLRASSASRPSVSRRGIEFSPSSEPLDEAQNRYLVKETVGGNTTDHDLRRERAPYGRFPDRYPDNVWARDR